jgi:hypothetical protein
MSRAVKRGQRKVIERVFEMKDTSRGRKVVARDHLANTSTRSPSKSPSPRKRERSDPPTELAIGEALGDITNPAPK